MYDNRLVVEMFQQPNWMVSLTFYTFEIPWRQNDHTNCQWFQTAVHKESTSSLLAFQKTWGVPAAGDQLMHTIIIVVAGCLVRDPEIETLEEKCIDSWRKCQDSMLHKLSTSTL